MRSSHDDRIWASQGGLSRNKVAVGESAAGSPPNDRDLADVPGPPYTASVHLENRTTRPARAPKNYQG